MGFTPLTRIVVIYYFIFKFMRNLVAFFLSAGSAVHPLTKLDINQ